MTRTKGNLAKRAVIAILVVLALLVAGSIWYVNDYYHADDAALAVVADADGDADGVIVKELPDGKIAFEPANLAADQATGPAAGATVKPIAGLIFYPGAKVQPEAYAPLLKRLAERGILCVLVKPLFNLAIIDMDAANGIEGRYPEIDRWIIAGHSMGGVAACDYAERHESEFDAVALLASYPAVDLSGFEGDVVSLYGTEDGVLNRDRLAEARSSLPATAREVVIDGGNHACFGNYGDQAGDGVARISRESQQVEAADAIAQVAEG